MKLSTIFGCLLLCNYQTVVLVHAYHYYFAYGSNMALATMTAMRQLSPLESTAALLPNYKLRFNIPGIPGVEPSWSCVEETFLSKRNVVHGVLYKLTAQDFAKVSSSEGVPFVYQWKSCTVYPYQGNSRSAGRTGYRQKELQPVQAQTLVASFPQLRGGDIPPSKAYRDLMIRGAREFKIDEDYVFQLQSVPVGRTFLNGIVAGEMLERAERAQAKRQQQKE